MFQVSIGTPALSTFRLEKLRAALSEAAPGVALADTRHCYFSALKGQVLSGAQARLLDRVLGLGKAAGEPADADKCQRLLVVPRLGTISPWSTKATDIAQHCGLSGIERIERGVVYYLSTNNGKPLGKAELAALLPLLHDRMTETVLESINGAAEKIFKHGKPQPLETVNVLKGGDRKSTRLNSSHQKISYAGFCLKNKKVGEEAGAAPGAWPREPTIKAKRTKKTKAEEEAIVVKNAKSRERKMEGKFELQRLKMREK